MDKLKYKIGIAVVLAIVVGIASYVGYITKTDQALGLADSSFAKYATDVIGTKSATTTTGVNFRVTSTGGQSATSSYVSRIGENTNEAIYTIMATAVSSTANAVFEIQGSNDDYCDTSTSTTIYDIVTTDQINWFSAGDHLKGRSQGTALSSASSTAAVVWTNPKQGEGQEIILENLNYECLRLNVSGSSTVLWAQINTK